jgi:hypothetical protein
MLRPFRLIMLATLTLGVYMGFFQVPDDRAGVADFDPAVVAQHEIEAWQAAKGKEEVGAFIAHVLQARELHRYSWFRAGQAGLDMARTTTRFVDLRGRYERVLPNLEAVATVEKDWKQLSFDPAVVARTQLNWMVTARMPNLNDTNEIASQMAEEYALRYGFRTDQMFSAAAGRAEAFKFMINATTDPDWAGISKLLQDSYVELQKTLRNTPRASS